MDNRPLSAQKQITLYRENFLDGYRFYRLDDHDRSRGISISESTLLSFVKRHEDAGGIDFLYSHVIAEDEHIIGVDEVVHDIRNEDGAVLWMRS